MASIVGLSQFVTACGNVVPVGPERWDLKAASLATAMQ